ncbi:putative collagen-binding protein [Terriglobus roseus DSM 18391]|uniref:Putative collagen-binding protein n=1 Tax=Terriglobus roseus (strain DSM 18391 / NRRL B-41598 / KBS 63) TaxID=926566 RepID=I3ZIX2_TERRK|nr:TonB-dependent receptor [Terriglobus roseus]AFL89190.1 putative collagen-binding protein [Terriglobus roseus DSM 18391]
MRTRTLLPLAAVAVLANVAFGQVTNTSAVGVVTDASGAAVANASVVLLDVDRNQTYTATANEQGEFRINLLPSGRYQLTITAAGFKTQVQKDITLFAGVASTLDTKLQMGAASEQVDVIAGAATVNTASAEIGTTIERRQITELPLVDRNPYTLLDITPGVQSNANSIVLGFPEQRTKINGGVDAGTGSVNYYLDGATNMTALRNTGNIVPNPDATQEFRVQTSGYGADQGRFSSGVINVVTRSGTNAFHGSIFEFFRNDALKARDWGSSALPKAPLNRNQFGAAVGGPVRKDKTFFFGSYAGLRQTSSTFLTGAGVPTAAERNGDFSADPIAQRPIDPVTGTFFTCNGVSGVICANRQDAVARRVIDQYIPQANVGTNQWKGYFPTQYTTDEFLAKIDQTLSDRNKVMVEYFNTSGNTSQQSGSPNLPWSTINYQWRQQNAIISVTSVATPNIVNQVWLAYTRNLAGRLNTPATSLGDLGSTYTIQGPKALPAIAVTGFFSLAEGIAGPKAGTNFYSVRDLITFTHAKHSLRMGGEFALDKDIQIATQPNYGTFTFNATITAGSTVAPGTAGPAVKYAGNALASFIIGTPASVVQASPTYGYTNSFNTAFFVQDDYRATRQLTLNMGVRWDIQTPPTDPQNKNTTYVPGARSVVYPNAPVGQLFPGDPGVTRGIVAVKYGHVSPRFGFAFDPSGHGTTSIRGSFGMYFGSVSGNEWNIPQNYQPFALSYSYPNAGVITGATLANPYRINTTGNIANPFPFTFGFVTGAAASGIGQNFKWPYTYQTNVSIQQQVTKSLGIQVAYVGSLGKHLPFGPDVNAPRPNATASTTAANVLSRRPNPIYGPVNLIDSTQSAYYDSLQIEVRQRLGSSLSVNGYYTWSKTIDTVDLGSTTSFSGAQNNYNLTAERGRASDDFRHMASVAIVWKPTVYRGDRGLLRAVLNQWQISTITKLHSGTPYTILNGLDANLDGSSTNDRAQLVGDFHLANRSVSQWFNTTAFQQNAATTGAAVDGNSSRNMMTGPFYKDVDLSLMRQFPLFRESSLQIRADGTNALNLTSYNTPGVTVGAAAFGRITGAATTRILQLGAKLIF